jgi:hypothetical protein
MDEEPRRYPDAMMQRINGQFERVLDRLHALETDFQNTKGFLVADSLVSGRRRLGLDGRVSSLERRGDGPK